MRQCKLSWLSTFICRWNVLSQVDACQCRSLYGECIFSAHTAADLQLADELLQATASSLFRANARSLVTGFNNTLLSYETAYFAAMSNGVFERCHLYDPFTDCSLHVCQQDVAML